MNEKNQRTLLAAARSAVKAALAGTAPPAYVVDDEDLRSPRGVFVSVHVDGDLRGCIGIVSPVLPLIDTVMSCAVSAATGDMRFAPLTIGELSRAVFEISVLSPSVAVQHHGEIIAGTHGLIITHGGRTGLLLPQVATQHGMTADQFLEAVCQKAGLAAGTWRRKDVRLQRFTAEVFSEAPAVP